MLLRLNRKTVVRKLLFLAKRAELKLEASNRLAAKATTVEFDDLITIEHTKCKPLAVTVMVEKDSRRILGLEVARIPANGHLAKIAKKKYGPRKDERSRTRPRLFKRVVPYIADDALIKSDLEPHYGVDVKRYFPRCRHERFESRKAAIAGQGELKRAVFDPIFSINHTLAMLRANINRLIRRTWCTTKRPDRLRAHLFVYAVYHNEKLI